MSKGNTFENELLAHILNNANIALIGDATGLRGSTAAGNLYLSLHTADPGETGDQATSEANYSGYARVAVARDGTAWTIVANAANLTAAKSFANPSNTTSLPQTASHFGVGVSASGAGKLLYKGAITPNITIDTVGVTPQLGTGTTITED